MGSPSEVTQQGQKHLAAIKAAIEAAREDGFLTGFETEEFKSQHVQLFLWQNRRGEDGVMRRIFEQEITDGYT
jgi:hypothetical protein